MRHALALAALLLLSGCMIVDDFAGYWRQGKTDVCLNKIAESIHYYAFKRDLAEGDIVKLARGLTLDKAQFLMLKKEPRDNGGYLYRFRVENGVFMRYRLRPTMRDTFAKEYPDAPVRIRHDTVTLAMLDAPAVALLKRITADERYWEKEDATLYNPLHNPLCIYEDRDLKTLEE